MNTPNKKYLLIVANGNGNYAVTEYETLEEALITEKYSSDWYIAEVINDLTIHGHFKKVNVSKSEENEA